MGPFHVTRQFHDPDEAAAAIPGTHLEISVLGPPTGPWSVTDIADDGVRLVCGRTASPFSGCGDIAADSRLVCWPMSDDTGAWTMNGRNVQRSTLLRLDVGADYASLTSRPLNWAALVIPASDDEERRGFS